ncbi:MAG TPA: exo-beta-N-acetylmuramidase NamZ domain-containing protein, partial [Armatimonadota bacterium]|nr:exo-beta-N-acetylmuramidase NamZ domain-containing protein [Armatimonadota bacterium]
MEKKGNVVCGLDVLLAERVDQLKGKSIGIVANHAAVTHDLTHITDALHGAGIKIKALFGPEHGIRGDAAEGAAVGDSVDARLGAPVYSLYGKISAPTDEMLE